MATPLIALLVAMSVAGEPDGEQTALQHLDAAHEANESGDVDQALAELDQALAQDPELAAAYLTRAELLVNRLGDLDAPPDDKDERRRWADDAELAAGDLGEYLRIADPDAALSDTLRGQQAELEAAARDARSDEDDAWPVVPVEPPEEEVVDDEPPAARPRKPLVWMTVTGAVLTGAGVGLVAPALQVRRTCDSDPATPGAECDRDGWTIRVPFLASGASAALLGASLVTAAAVTHARYGEDSPGGRTRRRRARIALFALSGIGLAATAVLGGLAGATFAGAPGNDERSLLRAQGLASAAISVGSAIPALLGASLGLLLAERR